MNNLFNQFFGLIATILSIISLLYSKKKKVMKIQMISNIMFTLQYIVLKAKSAAFVGAIAVLRGSFFSNNRYRRSKVAFLISLALFAAIFSYDGTFLSLIPIINSILCILGASMKNVRNYKVVYGICSAIWIYYNYTVGAYVVIISNIFEIISATIGYLKQK